MNSSEERAVEKGEIFWRSQRGCQLNSVGSASGAYDENRMKPETWPVREGRVNPSGIPYLYLATDKKTAVAEVRPMAREHVTICQIEATRGLRLLDCSWPADVRFLGGPSFGSIEAIWWEIDRLYSKPVRENTEPLDYLTTQVLSEYFRSQKYDGVQYNSGLEAGKNLALFDLSAGDVVGDTCQVVQVSGITLELDESPLLLIDMAAEPEI